MLQPQEVYRRIKPLDILPALQVLDKLVFKDSKGVCAWVSDPAVQAPKELLQLVRSCGFGGEYYRVFCRKLLPLQSISPHTDEHSWMTERNIRRFHIPLVSHPSITMRWPNDNIEVYLEPGYLYEVRVDRMHEVINRSPDIERIHIQIDQGNATI